jgi:hypothetical protein
MNHGMLGFTSATTTQVTGAEQTSNLKLIILSRKKLQNKFCEIVGFLLSRPFF